MDNYEDKDLMLEESLDKIMELLVDKQYFRARDELLKYNEADIAELLEEIIDDSGIQMAVILFRLLPKNISVEVFSYLPSNDQVDIINEITDKEITYIIQELDFDDKIDVLEELPANIVDKILEKAPKNERKQINTFLNYPENSAGSLMTPEYISLMKDWTVREALEHIKKEGIDAETIYTCYVKDTGRKLIGIVSLSTLVVTDDAVKIKDIMVTDYVYEDVDDDQEEVSEDFKKYGYLALPVVDSEHRLVGIITFDDILDVMEDEATEDIERMNGVIDFDDSDRGYLDTPVWQHALNRLPWLIILMVAYIFTGRIVTNFETSLSKVIELVAFMPMLMGTGGNTGSQAATLIIRGLATDEVDTDDALRVLWKEMRVGVIIGVILSVLNYLRIYFIDGIHNPGIALTVCTSMVFIVIFAKIIGSMIPLIVKKIHLDPALIANPAISSVSDAVALSIYFAMAQIFLPI
ncbi:magnesium transporter [Hornefia butyriciproducens]|jgi:magnesium transporter|uniref:Magnesium transporter MgtE n=3 Tax=Hornefia butyriciproducens TaxID=2652293 RepID=A0A6L5Y2Z2_9FIRM|nr:magnesium transporter [Hornefia butyriciproducens]MCI7413490.1 magnesium transporter [Clostridiales bacterium]MDD7019155.1 magnesium transporter [Hornefia butyriciproducens]MDY2990254.1 magnesium transporter [Hornefia butyriciproducens]MDY5422954.1 magnesium transporter [Hornefia butyriciproducens]MDY5462350.1 magnesium transporter [Hornefia butyriciproducens]